MPEPETEVTEPRKSGAAPSDPTKLTTDAIGRDILALKELLTSRIDGKADNLKELINTQLSGIERATDLRLADAHQIRPETEKLITALERLLNERFNGIDRQFAERDVRTEQAATASKQALDAALLAAKELVGQQNEANARAAEKAELSTIKQIDQIVTLIQTSQKGTDDRIAELKERIDRGEGSVVGSRVTSNDTQQSKAYAVSVLAVVIAGIAVVSAIVASLAR